MGMENACICNNNRNRYLHFTCKQIVYRVCMSESCLHQPDYVIMNFKQRWASKKYRNKEGMKTQEDYLATEKSLERKIERLLYICFIVRQQKQSSLPVFLTTIFLQQENLLVFNPCLVSVLFKDPFLLEFHAFIQKFFYPQFYVPFSCCLAANP